MDDRKAKRPQLSISTIGNVSTALHLAISPSLTPNTSLSIRSKSPLSSTSIQRSASDESRPSSFTRRRHGSTQIDLTPSGVVEPLAFERARHARRSLDLTRAGMRTLSSTSCNTSSGGEKVPSGAKEEEVGKFGASGVVAHLESVAAGASSSGCPVSSFCGGGSTVAVNVAPSPLSSRSPSPAWAQRGNGVGWGRMRALVEDFRDREGRLRIPPWAHAWAYLGMYVLVSVSFAAALGIWHGQIFSSLDVLAHWLKGQGLQGEVLFGMCIFLTTIPPIPMYSTLIILSGYSLGLWQGFIVSCTAALLGAVLVFHASRIWLRPHMAKMLARSPSLKRVVRAIERRPRLLFLIRLSPYPYNVMNVLLASSDTLSFKTYFWCTALSLPKLLIHVSIGTTIRDFTRPASVQAGMSVEDIAAERDGERLKLWAGVGGIALALGVFVYLLIVARRAVDELVLDEHNTTPPQAIPPHMAMTPTALVTPNRRFSTNEDWPYRPSGSEWRSTSLRSAGLKSAELGGWSRGVGVGVGRQMSRSLARWTLLGNGLVRFSRRVFIARERGSI